MFVELAVSDLKTALPRMKTLKLSRIRFIHGLHLKIFVKIVLSGLGTSLPRIMTLKLNRTMIIDDLDLKVICRNTP